MGKRITLKYSFYMMCVNLVLTFCEKSIKMIDGCKKEIPFFSSLFYMKVLHTKQRL